MIGSERGDTHILQPIHYTLIPSLHNRYSTHLHGTAITRVFALDDSLHKIYCTRLDPSVEARS